MSSETEDMSSVPTEGTPSVGQEQVTRYVGSQQLLDLGIINSPQTFIEWEGATK